MLDDLILASFKVYFDSLTSSSTLQFHLHNLQKHKYNLLGEHFTQYNCILRHQSSSKFVYLHKAQKRESNLFEYTLIDTNWLTSKDKTIVLWYLRRSITKKWEQHSIFLQRLMKIVIITFYLVLIDLFEIHLKRCPRHTTLRFSNLLQRTTLCMVL